MNIKMNKCKICEKEILNPNGFGNHIKQYHKMEIKEYYDLYLKQEFEGKCKHCKENNTQFLNVIKGYREYCSRSCSKYYQPNHKCWNKGLKTGIPSWNKGLKMGPPWNKGLKTGPHSDEAKRKMRVALVKRLEAGKLKFPGYHIKELGYFVDGYDKENNTVYEFDEPWHFQRKGQREKDEKREKEIIEFLKCKFFRISV